MGRKLAWEKRRALAWRSCLPQRLHLLARVEPPREDLKTEKGATRFQNCRFGGETARVETRCIRRPRIPLGFRSLLVKLVVLGRKKVILTLIIKSVKKKKKKKGPFRHQAVHTDSAL